MSAIAGIYHLNDEPINLEHGRRMMKDLEKYPADDVQIWHSEKVFLGCHAQWITPESIGEKLPYYDQERKLAITADAIIDNRDELFERLQVDKRKRKEITDSELILLSYHKWGEDSPNYLIGDFAFMVWDESEQKLFGARDFSGARTLYYHSNGKRFAFCTVLNPLLNLPNMKKELNEQWLAEFLAITAPVDTVDVSITPYKNLEQVPPSHSISIYRGKIRLKRYCTLSVNNQLKLKSNEEYVEAFQDVFQEAVRSCLRTHRGVGSQLSGGLDSGSVVSFAVKSLKAEKQLHTFSYIPPSDFIDYTPKYLMPDESPFIQLTAKHVGGIKEHYLDFEGRNSYSDIDDYLNILEMPYKFFHNSFWQEGIFQNAIKEGIGVLLSGYRGNLGISWGPAMDYYAILLKKMKWIRLINELQQFSQIVGGPGLRRIPIVARKAFPIIERIFPVGGTHTEPTIINPEFAKKTNVYRKLKNYGIDETGWFSTPNVFEQRKRHFQDVFHWNATNTLLTKLSLRYSLQQRDPTNDLRVIRFCLSVPEEQYVQNGLDRALVRRSTENFLPDTVRLNQRIRGVQAADWVHRMVPYWKAFIEEVRQLSENQTLLEYVDNKVIKDGLSKIESGAQPDKADDPHYRILMHSVILNRFLNSFH
ncbi:asparagine synthase (glutamine-hydrolyzing) [Bacillus niacini]|uniref:asparagine synthase (glutamine-hydrolyzing) n=1 Tax=Neobacillus niacini TaxID=86668 RepID=A0A852T8H9_9BACI|nr:lasso peptide isopeptide bond-forming cyclase [Neobacillus niacini]NYE03838.1 asparagine synthase (glutamine-hydrolyzing) [Neobacillus niacini]